MTINRKRSRGMTLVELMIVVMIVGILAAVAYPSYRQQVIRANRTEAKTQLMSLAGDLEKCYTRWHAYNSANCNVAAVPTNNYNINIQTNAATFMLTATPTGGQLRDTKCGALTLAETGARGQAAGGTTRECW